MNELLRKVESNHLIIYDYSSWDSKILEMRKKKSRIKTILQQFSAAMPVYDEIVLLCHILNVLDKHQVAVSRGEILKAFNYFYNQEFHGEKRSYLSWIYGQFNVKKGTKVSTCQNRQRGSENIPLSRISGDKKANIRSISELECLSKAIDTPIKENHEKTPESRAETDTSGSSEVQLKLQGLERCRGK